MSKGLAEVVEDELRPEYDLAQLRGGVRGKYYRQAKAGTNLVLIEPDLVQAFPDEASVNRALRLLVSTANAATRSTYRRKARQAKRATAKRERSVATD
ncbi:MAG TPA: hypothetical protein VKM93_05950 [Terriglobia bacterium]|nr:hypothetical protein [Terriglobia bacterium]